MILFIPKTKNFSASSVSQQLNYVSLKTISCFECLLHYSFSIIGKANIICAKGQTTESTCFVLNL